MIKALPNALSLDCLNSAPSPTNGWQHWNAFNNLTISLTMGLAYTHMLRASPTHCSPKLLALCLSFRSKTPKRHYSHPVWDLPLRLESLRIKRTNWTLSSPYFLDHTILVSLPPKQVKGQVAQWHLPWNLHWKFSFNKETTQMFELQ